MNFCIYTVHLFLYKCIPCKVKSWLSNYCTFHISYVTTNTQKYKLSMKKKYSWRTSCCSCWSGQRFSSTSHLNVFHCHALGKNISLNAAHIPCKDQLWCPHMQHSWHPTETSDLVHYDHILSTSMLKKLLYWISEWRVWWKELHCYPFMCSKSVPNNVGSVEADIIPDNNIFGKCGLTKLESGLCKVCLGRPGEVGYYRAQCVKYVCSDHSLKWQHTL